MIYILLLFSVESIQFIIKRTGLIIRYENPLNFETYPLKI